MKIKEILLACDFSKESQQHKARLKRELAESANLSESDLLSIAAAGQEDFEVVTPGALCIHGIRNTPCSDKSPQCGFLSFENGVWRCKYKMN